MSTTRTRIAVSLSVSVALAATLAGTAGARIPEADLGGGVTTVGPAVVAVPDAFERAVQRRLRALEAEAATAVPDAVDRAIARRGR